MKKSLAIFTVLLCIIINSGTMAQLFQQDFSTPLTIFSNGASGDPTYVNSTTPSNSQFTFLSANNANIYISVPAAGDTASKLVMFRNNSGNVFLTRNVAFGGPPTALMVKFDFRLYSSSANSSQQPVNFYVGSSATNSNGETDTTNAHSRFTIGFRSDASFIVGPYTATPSPTPATYAGEQTITFVVNNSGGSLDYLAPNGNTVSVADDSYDLWVGNNLELDDQPARDGSQSLSVFKMRFGQSTTSTISIDNLIITEIPVGGGSEITNHFRTKQSGDWNVASTWETSPSGTTWSDATVTPYDTSNTITIRNGHTVTVTETVNVDQTTIEQGGTVIVNGTPVVFTIKDGGGPVDMFVNGLLKSTGTANANPGPHTVNAEGGLEFGSTGVYEHNQNSGAVPIAVWGTGSTMKLTGTTGQAPGNRNQNYHHLVFDTPGLSSNLNMNYNSGNYTISGNVTIASTGATTRWHLCAPLGDSSVTINIMGDVIHLSGNFSTHGTGNGNTTIIINHYGDIIATNGNFSITRGSQAGTGTTSWFMHNGSISLSNLETQNSNSAGARFIFTGTSSQNLTISTITYGGGGLPIRVDDGANLNLGSNVIAGNGAFIVNDFGGINTAQPTGFEANILTTGAITLSTSGNYGYNGSAAQVTGSLVPSTVNGLTVNNSAGVSLSANMLVNGSVSILGGDLDLNGNTLTLGSSATLTETPGNTVKGATGKIVTTRDLNAPAGVNVGGLGAMLTSSANLGSTLVERIHSVGVGLGNEGIFRQFNIVPTNNSGLNATLRFYYDESELNSIPEARLTMFKSPTGTNNTWNGIGGTVNTTDNYVELAGINDFSYWTLGDLDNPLPVELASFNASSDGWNVSLIWVTASELNNYGWEIERRNQIDENNYSDWLKIGFVNGTGNSSQSVSYSFIDKNVSLGLINYRLKQIDFDGSYSYSNLVEVDLGNGPVDFALNQNYPNPFNPTTSIRFEIPSEAFVNISIYNALGEKVATLLNEQMEKGAYTRSFDGSNLPSGIYIYQLTSGNIILSKKMLMLK